VIERFGCDYQNYMEKFFKKLFYTPNYLAMPVAGIAVYNRSITYIEFKNKRGILSLKTFGEVPLLPDTVRDGEIINTELFVKALGVVKSKISTPFVRISIPEEKTYLFDIDMPNVKSSEMREAIEFKLEENVPLKADEVFFEYNVFSNDSTDAKNTGNVHVNVSVIPKKIIKAFSDSCALAGLIPLSFEIESQMTARSVIASGDHRAFMIIHIKDDSTVLSFVGNNIVHFSSTISIGNKNLIENISRISKIPNAKTTETSQDAMNDAEILSSVINVFSVMKDEVEKFNSYIISKSESGSDFFPKKIDQIILCGKSASLPGFSNHISQNINSEILIANVWENILDINESLPAMSFQTSLGFATSIGLAIPNNK
jgi:type IV pilus assembly protein PilM